MAELNINMLLNVQEPTTSNLKGVNKSIEKGIGTVKINYDTGGVGKAKQQVDLLADAQKKAGKSGQEFADIVSMKGQSFAAYTVASTAIIKLTGAMSNAVREGIKLEVEMTKIAQTTNTSMSNIKANTQAILAISKNYGIAANKVAELTRLLTQTGMSFRDAAKGAEVLARTSLLASFDNLQKTTEGLITLMNSFGLSTVDAGKKLEIVNVLAKNFRR